jgi:hypothetical protein
LEGVADHSFDLVLSVSAPLLRPKPPPAGASGIFVVPPTFSAKKWV